jgi:TPR repeat protein
LFKEEIIMNEEQFWNIIETTQRKSEGDGDLQVSLIEKALGELPEPDILDFDRLLNEFMAASYTQNLWAAAYLINGGCSDDGFDYFRAWLIAQGKDVFQKALKDPETLVDVAEPDVELELLLYAAAKAYEARTRKKFTYPQYPTPELTGDEWEEDEEQLSKMYPRLFERFGSESAEAPSLDMTQTLASLKNLFVKDVTDPYVPEELYRQAVFLALDESPKCLEESAALLDEAAKQGHAGAQFLLGNCYQFGRGVPLEYSEAIKWYRLAADQNNSDAFAALGMMYHDGEGGLPQDYSLAMEWYRKAAEAGSPDGAFGLGLLYSHGLGVEQNQQEGIKWLRRAAEGGSEEAAKWFQQAADQGLADGQYNLGVMYEKGRGVPLDIARAAELYEAAAEQGHDRAQSNLGMLYSTGKGVPLDYMKAAELYRQSIANGNLIALCNLGVLYHRGQGVPQDDIEAVQLYRKAAEAGVALGQFNLGTMYERGLGVKQDYMEASRLYLEAANQNHALAQNNIGDFYETGRGVRQDFTKAAEWYLKAAEKGVSVAQNSIGQLYRDGQGAPQNLEEAEKWFRLAADQGLESAKKNLAALLAGEPPK